MSEIKQWGISSESPRIIKQFDALGETSVIIGSASGYTGSPYFPTDEEAIENARLMAAAQDLLEALRAMVDTCKPTLADLPNLHPNLKAEPEYAAYFKARAAIAKACDGSKF